jgi:hypothetical protein
VRNSTVDRGKDKIIIAKKTTILTCNCAAVNLIPNLTVGLHNYSHFAQMRPSSITAERPASARERARLNTHRGRRLLQPTSPPNKHNNNKRQLTGMMAQFRRAGQGSGQGSDRRYGSFSRTYKTKLRELQVRHVVNAVWPPFVILCTRRRRQHPLSYCCNRPVCCCWRRGIVGGGYVCGGSTACSALKMIRCLTVAHVCCGRRRCLFLSVCAFLSRCIVITD